MSELPDSYVVVDARTKRMFAPDAPFHMLGVIAIDLPSDLWRDFVFFVEEARAAEHRGDAERRYRFIRASLLCLFAHLNAFFDIFIASLKNDSEFQHFKQTETAKRKADANWPRSEHGRFVAIYTEFATTIRHRSLPTIDWSIKALRNLLAHPTGTASVTVADLYNADLADLFAAAQTFQAWIAAVAVLCGIDYELDTAAIAQQFAATVAKTEGPINTQRF